MAEIRPYDEVYAEQVAWAETAVAKAVSTGWPASRSGLVVRRWVGDRRSRCDPWSGGPTRRIDGASTIVTLRALPACSFLDVRWKVTEGVLLLGFPPVRSSARRCLAPFSEPPSPERCGTQRTVKSRTSGIEPRNFQTLGSGSGSSVLLLLSDRSINRWAYQSWKLREWWGDGGTWVRHP